VLFDEDSCSETITALSSYDCAIRTGYFLSRNGSCSRTPKHYRSIYDARRPPLLNWAVANRPMWVIDQQDKRELSWMRSQTKVWGCEWSFVLCNHVRKYLVYTSCDPTVFVIFHRLQWHHGFRISHRFGGHIQCSYEHDSWLKWLAYEWIESKVVRRKVKPQNRDEPQIKAIFLPWDR